MRTLTFLSITLIAIFTIISFVEYSPHQQHKVLIAVLASLIGALSLLLFKEPIIQNKRIANEFFIYAFIAGLVYAIFKFISHVYVLDKPLESNRVLSIELFVIEMLLFCLFLPFLEEFIFRGILFDDLRKKFGALVAIIITSTLFLYLHIKGFNENYVKESLIIMTPGVALYVYFKLKTDNFLVSTIVHTTHNSFVLLMYYTLR